MTGTPTTLVIPSLPRALCKEGDKSKWFPEHNDEATIVATKRICNACPEQCPCLRWALDNEEWGTFAGFTEWERRAVRRQEARARRATFRPSRAVGA